MAHGMNDDEVKAFFEKVLGGLWTDWKPTAIEATLWKRTLVTMDYKVAREKMMALYASLKIPGKKPPLAKFKEAAGAAIVKSGHRAGSVWLFSLTASPASPRAAGSHYQQYYWWSRPGDEVVRAMAEKTRADITKSTGREMFVIDLICDREPLQEGADYVQEENTGEVREPPDGGGDCGDDIPF